MSDARRMHALMIGQPNFAAPPAPKGRARKNGRFVKAEAAPEPEPAPAPEAASVEPEPAADPPPAEPAADAPAAEADSWKAYVERQIGRA